MKERSLNDISFFLKVCMYIKCFDVSKGQSAFIKLEPKKIYEFELSQTTRVPYHLDPWNNFLYFPEICMLFPWLKNVHCNITNMEFFFKRLFIFFLVLFLHLFWITNVFECMTKSVSLLQRSRPFPSDSWASISRSSQTPEINARVLKDLCRKHKSLCRKPSVPPLEWQMPPSLWGITRRKRHVFLCSRYLRLPHPFVLEFSV